MTGIGTIQIKEDRMMMKKKKKKKKNMVVLIQKPSQVSAQPLTKVSSQSNEWYRDHTNKRR
jgi:hypothetical protein